MNVKRKCSQNNSPGFGVEATGAIKLSPMPECTVAFCIKQSRDRLIGIVTTLRAGWSVVRISVGGTDLSAKRPGRLWGLTSFLLSG